MIQLNSVKKMYGKKTVIEDASCRYDNGKIYGLIGYNGSGKTTLLKTIAGIYRPDGGEILVDGEPATDNEKFLQKSFLMTEELFFDIQSTPDDMGRLYRGYYPRWDEDVYRKLMELSMLDRKGRIAGFSKGMQRQTGLILAISTMPEYLFLDETFDGLDMSRRKMLRRILRLYAEKKNAVIIVTSHYLNELEDMIDLAGMIEDTKLVIPDLQGRTLEEYFTEKSGVNEDAIDTLFG